MYEITIGLEIHCELKTATKLFCSCPNEFGKEPNTACCEGCLAFPGTLPLLNRKAVEYTVKAGLCMGCEILRYSRWDRKSYFYPDLLKAWQTSQSELPLCKNGLIEFSLNGEKKRIRINRIHLEEDAGKLIHENGVTKIDNNRGGLSLMEIVTEPDLHSADEAVAFLEQLKSIIKYSGVSNAKMQEGSLRCDVNLSVAPKGSEKLGVRTETKNLNSFSSVKRAILFEAERQISVLNGGGKLRQETRRWDDSRGEGYAMRVKENAQDYRYFPEADVPPVILSDKEIAEIRNSIPKMRNERIEYYTTKLGLPLYDAEILTLDKAVADLFEKTLEKYDNPKKISNYIMSEIMRKGKTDGAEDLDIGIGSETLSQILKLIEDGVISLASSKEVLDAVWHADITPAAAVEKLGLKQNSDTGEIGAAVKAVLDANPKVVQDYKAGNEKVMAFFVGQVMKATKGKGNPAIVNEVLKKLLS